MNSKSRTRRATLLASALILASCAEGPTPPPNLTVPVRTSAATTPALACAELPPLGFAPGAPGATFADVLAAGNAHPDDPLAWVRGVVGDTKSTRDSIADYAARRAALGCAPR